MAIQGEVKSGNFGTSVLSGGVATVNTLIDLTGVSQNGDLVVLSCRAEHLLNATFRHVWLFDSVAENRRVALLEDLSTSASTAFKRRKQATFVWQIGDPGASLYYRWSGAPTGAGLDVWVGMNLRGFTL